MCRRLADITKSILKYPGKYTLIHIIDDTPYEQNKIIIYPSKIGRVYANTKYTQ